MSGMSGMSGIPPPPPERLNSDELPFSRNPTWRYSVPSITTVASIQSFSLESW